MFKRTKNEIKMYLKYKISILIFAALIFSSCKKTYLDRVPYTSGVLNTAIMTEADLGTAVNGSYATLRSYYLFGASISIKGDLMADNTFITTSNSGRYIGQNNFSMINTDAYAANFWSLGYTAIKYANTVINNTLGLSTANANQYVGEAYAIRALMYFELVRNFAHAYTLAPNDPGIPLVPDNLSYDPSSIIEVHPKRNTVKEVYTQIIADLEKAYSLMTVYRGTAYFSKYAARAIEARVYQNMGDWTNAQKTALDVINNSGWVMLSSTAYVNPSGSFGTTLTNGSYAGQESSTANTYSPGGYWAAGAPQTSTKNETLFEVASDLTNNNAFEQIGSLYLKQGGGYGDICATDTLYNLYSATDVRKGLIPRAPAGYRSGQAGNLNLCYKYPNAFASGDRDDVKVIRLSDVILITAEAYYNLSDPTNALLYLNKVAKQRDASFAGYASAGSQILEDILTERRKELAFEGQRLWDLVRLNRSWTKYRNQSPLTTIAATATNPYIIYPIPLVEINANPNITQNPNY